MVNLWDHCKWFIIIISLLAVIGIAYGLGYGAGTNHEQVASLKKVEDQKIVDLAECHKVQQTTTSIDDGLQKDLAAINGRLSLGVLRGPSCIMPELAGDPVNAHAAGGTRPVGNPGLSTQWVRKEVAAPGSRYRAMFLACRQMLIEERK